MSKKVKNHKSKALFILDRPDFLELRKLIEDEPGIEMVDAAELRLRAAREAFLEHNHKLQTDRDAIVQAMATQVANPRELEEPAREFHRALFAWCNLAAEAFEVIHNRAVDEMETRRADFQKWGNKLQTHPVKEERDAAMLEIQKIRALDAEPLRIKRAALRGRNAVKAAFHFTTGRSIPEANEAAFVRNVDPLRKVA